MSISLRLCLLLILFLPSLLRGQQNSTNLAVSFLLIAPDTRSSGMGDVGAATTPDVFSINWNAAKYAFTSSESEIGVVYSPWQRALIKDQNLLYLSGYYRTRKMETIAASLKYFSLGKIYFSDLSGGSTGEYTPNELSLDIAYIRQLFTNVSISTTFKYIHSGLRGIDLSNGNANKGSGVAVDVGMFYIEEINQNRLSIGFSLSNLGPQMLYGTQKLPLPTIMRLGGMYTFIASDESSFALTTDIARFLVGNQFKNKLYSLSFGTEYDYRNLFSLRAGYHTEANQTYFTGGLGLKFKNITGQFSYLFSTQNFSTLQNTSRFGLIYSLK